MTTQTRGDILLVALIVLACLHLWAWAAQIGPDVIELQQEFKRLDQHGDYIRNACPYYSLAEWQKIKSLDDKENPGDQ